VAGDGLDWVVGTRFLTVGQGNGITVGPNAIAVLALSTGGLTVLSTGVQVLLPAISGLDTNSTGLFIKRRGLNFNESGIAMSAADGIYLADTVAGAGLEWKDAVNRFMQVSVGEGLEFSDLVGGVGADVRVKLAAGSGLLRDGTGLYLNPLLAGDGLVMASGIIDIVPTNASLVFGASNNSIHVNPAHTWAWTGTHSHAGLSTFNAGATFNTGVFRFNTAPQVNADINFLGSSNNITASSLSIVTTAGDITLDPFGSNVLPGGSIEDDLGYYNRKWRTLYAAELYVETLVAQDVMATIGGRIMVAPTTTLVVDVSSGALTITVKNQDPSFVVNSYVLLQTALGGHAQYEVMKITSTPVTIAGTPATYRYNVARNVDGSNPWPGGGVQGNQWVAGDAVVSLGKEVGSGYIDLSSTATVHNKIGPTITIYSRTSMANWNDIVPTTTMGNLLGFVDYETIPEFGFAVGNNLTNKPNDPITPFQGLTADRTKGLRLFNTDSLIYHDAQPSISITQADGLSLQQDTCGAETERLYIAWYDPLTYPTDLDNLKARIQSYGGGGDNVLNIETFGRAAGESCRISLSATEDDVYQSAGLTLSTSDMFMPSNSMASMGADFCALNAPKTSIGSGINTNRVKSTLHVYESTSAIGVTGGITIDQQGSGDALLQFVLSSPADWSDVRRWMAGIDHSAAGFPFVISSKGNLTGTPEFVLTANGGLAVSALSTGDLTVTGTVTAPVVTSPFTVGTGIGTSIFGIDGGATSSRQLQFKSAGSLRWVWNVDNIAEAGANVGSDLALWSRSDTGAAISSLVMTWQRSTGNVGIGKVAASGIRLDVAGTIAAPLATLVDLDVTAAATVFGSLGVGSAVVPAKLSVYDTAQEVARFTSGSGSSGTVQGYAYIGLDPTTPARTYPGVRIGAEEFDILDLRANLLLQTRAASATDLEPTTKMVITHDGMVGINSLGLTPSVPLHVVGNTTGGGAATAIRAENTATLGYAVLQTINNAGSIMQFQSFGTAFTGTTFGETRFDRGLMFWNGGGSMAIGSSSNVELFFATNDIRRLTISSAGRVGIGEITLGAWLDVGGADATAVGVRATHYGVTSPHFVGRRSGGNKTTPANVASGVTLMHLAAYGYTSGGWALNPNAEIRMVASENYTLGNTLGGAEMQFFVRKSGAPNTTTLQAMTIYNDGGMAMHTVFGRAYTFANWPRPLLMDNLGYLTAPNIYALPITHSQSKLLSVNPDGVLGPEDLLTKTMSSTTIRPVVVDENNYGSAVNLFSKEITPGTDTRPLFITTAGYIGWQNMTTRTYGGLTVTVTFDGKFGVSTSSRRYKEDIQTIAPDSYTQLFDSLRPVRYRLKDSDDKREYAGLIAEDVHDAGGQDFVHYDQEGQPLALMYDQMIVMLIMELRQLKNEVREIKKERLN
jgi:hypothetical protein